MYGFPGCGKTWFAKALAKEVGLPLLKISPADFLRGVVGETEARTRQIINLLESLAPAIVFVDEYDQIALRRDRQFVGDSGVSRRLQNALLDWLGDEGRKTFIIGATNFIDLDPAFIRSGRIDKTILVLPPDREARKQILHVHTDIIRKVPLIDVDFDELSSSTFMFTGAELEALVLSASSLAMDEASEKVTMNHFRNASSYIEVNPSERMKRIQGMIEAVKRLETVDRQFVEDAVRAFVKSEKDQARVKGFLEGL